VPAHDRVRLEEDDRIQYTGPEPIEQSDPVYWGSIVSSVIFAAASTGLAMSAALVLALLTDRELRGSRIYRSVLVWPFAIAAPAASGDCIDWPE
jgi:ABC-type sugar transport system permease subunit